MDEKERIGADFAFLEEDERVLAVLLFGSSAKKQADGRSDLDLCIVAPKIRVKSDMRKILRKTYGKCRCEGKKIQYMAI